MRNATQRSSFRGDGIAARRGGSFAAAARWARQFF
jgi:hypothetical protein